MSGRTPRTPGLGRGLSALFGEIASDGGGTPTIADTRTLPVTSLHPHPHQPRRRFDDSQLDELAQSIAARGLIQPIVVRPHGHGYQIVAGERRWRAAQRAKLLEVPVVVRELDEAQTLEIALLENIQREDLNAIEEAQAYQRLARDYGHTQEALATIVNKSRSHIANLLRLLDLPEPVQARVIDGSLSMGHARALLGAGDIDGLAMQVVGRGLSVRETEKLARAAKRPPAERRETSGPDPDIAALEQQLTDLLGVGVRVAHGHDGGTLTLHYATLDQLDMLCQRLTGEGL